LGEEFPQLNAQDVSALKQAAAIHLKNLVVRLYKKEDFNIDNKETV